MVYKMVCAKCEKVFETNSARKYCDCCVNAARRGRNTKHDYVAIASAVLDGVSLKDIRLKFGIKGGLASIAVNAVKATAIVLSSGNR